MATVSPLNGIGLINPRQSALQPERYNSSFSLTGFRFGNTKRHSRSRQHSTVVVRAVAANQDIDFNDPNWIQHYQEEFEKRFDLPHLKDVFDIEPIPTTFSLKCRGSQVVDGSSILVDRKNGYVNDDDRALLKVTGSDSDPTADVQKCSPFCLLMLARQFLVAMLVLDTWQYFMHRYMHHNKFLYKHIHSQHHQLVVPYAFGALYNHPVEGLLLDTIGGALAFLLSGMSPRASIYFFSFATIKAVDDHCGLWLPGNLFHLFFKNSTAYHDVHHQLYGTKYNFSQPFFVMWDRLLGTYMPYSLEERVGGGFEARPTRDCKTVMNTKFLLLLLYHVYFRK